MIPDAKALGQWIRKRRLELDGMNQQQLADRVENPETGKPITRSYVHKLENATPHNKSGNPPAPSLDLLYNLSRALQTSLAAPLAELGYLKKAEADKMESPTTHPIRLLNWYNELVKEDQVTLELMAKTLWERRHVRPQTAESKSAQKLKSHKSKTA